MIRAALISISISVSFLVVGCGGEPAGRYVGMLSVRVQTQSELGNENETRSEPDTTVAVTGMGEEGLFMLQLPDCSPSVQWDPNTREFSVKPGQRCGCSDTKMPGTLQGTGRFPTKGQLEFSGTSDNETGTICTYTFNGKAQ